MIENREVKSDVFSMLMQEQKYALDVYNALNGSNYEDPQVVEVLCLKSGISLTVRNDASFIVDMHLSMYEHQSTHNPNMPLRFLIYVSDMLKDYVKTKDYDVYGRSRIVIPNPQFVVFYNGIEKRPEVETFKLSDSFYHRNEDPKLELICTVYNINQDASNELLQNCTLLKDYAKMIAVIRDYSERGVDSPIEQAITYCIENDILADFLIRRHDEVVKAMTIDMTWENRERLIRRDERAEGREEGRAEGRAEGVISTVVKAYSNGMISLENALALTNISEDEFKKKLEEFGGADRGDR